MMGNPFSEFHDGDHYAVKVKHLRSVPVAYCISREGVGRMHKLEWFWIGNLDVKIWWKPVRGVVINYRKVFKGPPEGEG